MIKKLVLIVFLALIVAVSASAQTYVSVYLDIQTLNGQEPRPAPQGMAYWAYLPFTDPAVQIAGVRGIWNATDKRLEWTLPLNAYVRFEVSSLGLDDIFQITGSSPVVVNTLLPAQGNIPEQPTWALNMWACNQQPQCDIVSDYDIDCVDGRFSGDVAIDGNCSAANINLDGVCEGGAATDIDITVGAVYPYQSGMLPLGDADHMWGNAYINGVDYILRLNQNTPNELLAAYGTFEIIGRDTDYAFHPMAGRGQDCAWFDTYDGSIMRGRMLDSQTVGATNNKPQYTAYNSRGATAGAASGTMYQGSFKRADRFTGDYLAYGLANATDVDIIDDYRFRVKNSGEAWSKTQGTLWGALNDGTGSGLDADTLDGDHGSAFLKAESDPRVPAAGTSGNVMTSNGSAWISAAPAVDGDSVIGNEVTDAGDTTLTRTGTGTSGVPYKLKLNLGNANTWTVNQKAPYFIQSSQYNADNPRPSGWPESAANALDDEFNSTGTPSNFAWHNISGTPAATQSGGFCKFTGAATSTGTFVKSVSDGDVTFATKLSAPLYGSAIGLVVLDSNGTGYGAYLDYNGGSYYKILPVTITTWTTVAAGTAINYNSQPYLGIRYYNDGGTRKASIGISRDGKSWSTFWYGITTGVPSTVAYIGFYVYNGYATGDFMGSDAAQYADWFRIK